MSAMDANDSSHKSEAQTLRESGKQWAGIGTNRPSVKLKKPFELTPLSSASLESTKMVGQSRHNNCTASFRFTEIRSKYGRQRKEWGDRERTFFIVVLSIIADHYSERVTIREQ